jgi:hypothetical protein
MNFAGRKGFLSLTLLLHAFPSVTLLIAILASRCSSPSFSSSTSSPRFRRSVPGLATTPLGGWRW